MKRYAILGYRGSGKSTAGKIIAELTGGKSASVSEYIVKAMNLAGAWAIGPELFEEMKLDPLTGPSVRREAYLFGRGAEWADPGSIIKSMLEDGVTVVCGMRTMVELVWAHAAGVFDRILFIDRGAPSSDDQITLEFARSMGGEIIDNHGTLGDLRQRLSQAIGKGS